MDALSIERETRAVQGKKHSVELQSLRGLAALLVVLHHSSSYLNYNEGAKRWVELGINAHACVVCFFVLSGYVLTLSLRGKAIHVETVFEFYLRRVFRIYPALWFALALAGLYKAISALYPWPAIASPWAHGIFVRQALTTQNAMGALLGVAMPLPIPVWSLFVELVASLLMPFMALALFRSRTAFAALFLLLAALSFSKAGLHMNAGVYLVDFAIGAGLVLWMPHVASVVRGKAFFPMMSLALLTLLFFREIRPWPFASAYDAPLPAMVEALSAALLIAAIQVRPESFTALRAPLLVWLGDISYSLYLVHLPILGLLALGAGSKLPVHIFAQHPVLAAMGLCLGTMMVSLAIAALSYRFIEVPGIRLGKNLGRLLGNVLILIGPSTVERAAR